jgi:hypothetical protein
MQLLVTCSNNHFVCIFVLLFLLIAAYDQESVLSLKNPSANPDGIVVLECDRVVVENEEFDSIVVLYSTWGDVREVKDKVNGIKAYIGKDGASLIVSKPRFPLFFKDKIQEMWAQDVSPYEQVVNAHCITMNAIDKLGPNGMNKTICYRFKEDIKFKLGPFNNNSDSMQLKTELCFAPIEIGKIVTTAGAGGNKKKKLKIPCPYVYWHLCLDKPSRVIVERAADEIDSDAQLARMFHMLSTGDGESDDDDDVDM